MDPEGTRYVNALVASPVLKGTVQMGDQRCTITDLSLSYPGYTGIATWDDLSQPTSHRQMTIEFRTPTAITKRTGEGKRFTSLYPEAQDLFLGLMRRWCGLDGPELPRSLAQYLDDHGCVVASHTLRTVQFKPKERTQIGFIGRVTYECLQSDPACITALNSLARLAFYTGIGYQTARGMGTVSVWLAGETK
jgi:CRISPR-associated endoribonuclease Cas6